MTSVAQREAAGLRYFRSPYSVDFEPTMFFMGTDELLHVKFRALKCFVSQHQLDMEVFRALSEVAFRQHVHHRVVERFPANASCAEMFRIAEQVEFAAQSGDRA